MALAAGAVSAGGFLDCDAMSAPPPLFCPDPVEDSASVTAFQLVYMPDELEHHPIQLFESRDHGFRPGETLR